MGGVIGRIFQEFAIIIVVAVLISGGISLSLTPMLASRFLKPSSAQHKKGRIEQLADNLNERMKRIYEPLLRSAMRHRLWVLGFGLSSIVLSYILFTLLPKDFLPPEDIGFIQAYTLSRDGTSPDLMAEYHTKACQMIRADENVDSMLSISSYNNTNEGIIFIRLKEFKERFHFSFFCI